MFRPMALVPLLFLIPSSDKKTVLVEAMSAVPAFTAGGEMKFPEKYREWVYLTSGLGMSYNSAASVDHPMFDNVFVSPAAYAAFLQTGTWPDKSVFVLEIRGAETKNSINKSGHSQSPEVMGVEVHVKDARLPNTWGFFEFNDDHAPAKLVEHSASCYSCHEAHAAVDTTFVQFYPTLIGIAKQKGTFSAAFLKEAAAKKN